jgi:hypothetical protein
MRSVHARCLCGLLALSSVSFGCSQGVDRANALWSAEDAFDRLSADTQATVDSVGSFDVVPTVDGAPNADSGPADVASAPDVLTDSELADAPEPPDTAIADAGDAPTPDVSHAALYPPDQIHSPLTPSVVARLSAVHAMDPALSDDVFMKAGASTTVSSANLGCFAGDKVALGEYSALQPTLDFFLAGDADGGDPFSRDTLAAEVGVSASWAIAGNPSPLEQEYLALSPAFAFVHYGTNDMGMATTYESALWGFGENLWTLTNELIGWGVIPVLITIGRRLDDDAADAWVDTYNTVIAGVAQGLQVPLLNANLAYASLPNYGMASDGIHSSIFPGGACQLTDAGLEYGMNMRNAQSLVALDRLRRAVLLGQALDAPGSPLVGVGTLADPLQVPSLPFTDLRSTTEGATGFDTYPGCNATQDEAGPEVVYRLELTAHTSLRATVHDLGAVDVDLHVLDWTGSPDGCLARAHRLIDLALPPGSYYVVLDTFVSGGVPKSGEYLLTLEARP